MEATSDFGHDQHGSRIPGVARGRRAHDHGAIAEVQGWRAELWYPFFGIGFPGRNAKDERAIRGSNFERVAFIAL